jgi:hypothetical protein
VPYNPDLKASTLADPAERLGLEADADHDAISDAISDAIAEHYDQMRADSEEPAGGVA